MSRLRSFDLRAERCVEVLGVTLRLRATDRELLDAMIARLPPGHRRCEVGQHDFVLARDHELVAYEGTRQVGHGGLALDRLETRMHLRVARDAVDRVFVHAGVVAWKGRAIVLPGPSYAGKSTLVAALVAAGATYLSDELAMLDAHGRVHAYPRAMSLRTEHGDRRVTLPSTKRAFSVGTILFARYRAGARFDPRPISRGRGTLKLFKNAIGARALSAESLAYLDRATVGASCFESLRGETTDVIAWLIAQ